MACLSITLLSLAFLLIASCRQEPDARARAVLHDAHFSFSVDDFLRAATEGREEIVRQFLEAGMNADVTDNNGTTAISQAAAFGHGHVVRLLLAHGAKAEATINDAGATVLMAAAKGGDPAAVQALLDAGANPAAEDKDGLTPIAAASLEGQAATVEVLAPRSTASLDHSLQLAAVNGHTSAISVLLDKGGNPMAAAVDGRTPLMFAASHGHVEAVKLLRARGAPVTALDTNMKTAANHADENGHPEIARILSDPDDAPRVSEVGAIQRIVDADLTSESWDSLEAVGVALQMTDYRAATFPLIVTEVSKANDRAVIRLLMGGERELTIGLDQEIPGTGLVVEKMTHKLIAAKAGQGKLFDVSQVILRDSTGRHHLAIRGQPVLSADTCAIIRTPRDEALWEVHRGDSFTAGKIPVIVTDIRPSQTVLEDAETKEPITIQRGVKR